MSITTRDTSISPTAKEGDRNGDGWPAPIRRIITSHTTSTSTAVSGAAGSSVIQTSSLVPLRPVLNDSAAITPLYSSLAVPTSSPAHYSAAQIQSSIDAVPGVVLPHGVNCQATELKPNVKVGMHRTSSVDYNIMVAGSAWHVTPTGAGTGPGQRGEDGQTQRELVQVGDVVVQRGTLHAWEAGPDGARWVCVVVAALPVEIDGEKLGEVDF